MKKNKKILIGTLILISLLIILPFFIPIKTYLTAAEKQASDKLGMPVTISSGHVVLLPSPRVVINGVAVGEGDALKISQITVIPALSSIFSALKVVDIDIHEPTIKKSALDIMMALVDGSKAETNTEANMINVRDISIHGLLLDWPGLSLPALNIEASLLDGQRLNSVLIESVDDTIRATVLPDNASHLISIQFKKWTFPIGLPVLIDQAQVEMRLKNDGLEAPHIEMDLYGGKLTANLNLDWHKGWHTKGKIKVVGLSVKAPSRLISNSVYFSGQLAGNGHFSSVGKDLDKLLDNINASFTFNVQDGVVHGVDLIKVASLLTKQTTGGETAFDDFSGVANMKGRAYHLKDLKLSSGLLTGSGQVEITANKQLDGSGEVAIKHSVSFVAVPLDISGTLDTPIILPSKAAVAGAVAGTAILGPGIGTSVGIKAAGAVDKLKGLFNNN